MKIIAVITEPLAVDCILQYLEKKGLPPFNLPKAHSPPGTLALSVLRLAYLNQPFLIFLPELSERALYLNRQFMY